LRAALFVIDPLLSHLHGKTDSHKDHEVKRALTPLGDLAHRTGCTILGNHHFRKDTSRGARSAAQASSAFTDVPRVTWGMAKDSEDESARVLEVLKSNIGPEGIGRDWRIQLGSVDGLDDGVPLILPGAVSRRSIDELLRTVGEGKRVPSEALRVLVLRELATGEKSREYLDAVAGDELGVSKNALYERALVPLLGLDQYPVPVSLANAPVQRVINDAVVRTDLEEEERPRVSAGGEVMVEDIIEVDLECELRIGRRGRHTLNGVAKTLELRLDELPHEAAASERRR
jgi:hypothetical protein